MLDGIDCQAIESEGDGGMSDLDREILEEILAEERAKKGDSEEGTKKKKKKKKSSSASGDL